MSFPDGARLSKWLIFKYARIEVAPLMLPALEQIVIRVAALRATEALRPT